MDAKCFCRHCTAGRLFDYVSGRRKFGPLRDWFRASELVAGESMDDRFALLVPYDRNHRLFHALIHMDEYGRQVRRATVYMAEKWISGDVSNSEFGALLPYLATHDPGSRADDYLGIGP